MFSYLPHTDEEIKQMLADIGVESIDELFADIPEKIQFKDTLQLPKGKSEHEVYSRLEAMAKKNTQGVSFLGAGIYDHIIPSTVGAIMGRTEFATSYTPYQPEISQGVLQAIFEFQTLMNEITSLPVSNASLYDGHTAASEACALAVNSTRKTDTILYSGTIHPYTKEVLTTYFEDLGVKLVELPEKEGVLDAGSVKEYLTPQVAALLVQSPNIYGNLEDYTGIADILHENKSLFIISSNPMSLGVLKSQGEWGADIAIGDTQPFGLPAYYGGPTVGYIAASEKLLRKMPGRIVGQTVDEEGKRAYVLTLQAREQHIKRERATSNICSNQALAALGTTVYLSTVGKKGLEELSAQNMQKAHHLAEKLQKEAGLELLSNQPFFNEFTLKLPSEAAEVADKMEKEGIFAGVVLNKLDPSYPKDLLTVAVTEKRTAEEMEKYVRSIKGALK